LTARGVSSFGRQVLYARWRTTTSVGRPPVVPSLAWPLAALAGCAGRERHRVFFRLIVITSVVILQSSTPNEFFPPPPPRQDRLTKGRRYLRGREAAKRYLPLCPPVSKRPSQSPAPPSSLPLLIDSSFSTSQLHSLSPPPCRSLAALTVTPSSSTAQHIFPPGHHLSLMHPPVHATA
jgi:hypothetical protein